MKTKPLGQTSLAWLLAKYPHVIPIPGTRRIAYLKQNIAAIDVALSSQDITWLDQLFHPADIHGARYPEGGFAGIEE